MQTIVWDVDDVLNDLTKEWFEQDWLVTHPECNIGYTQLISNPPDALLNIKMDEYHIYLDSFRQLHGMDLKPLKEVLSWFQKFGHQYRHIVLTSTPLFYTPHSSEWVFHKYGEWIRSFNFVPSARKNSDSFIYDLNKASFLSSFKKVDLFIDDNEKNIEEARKTGINSVLMPRPWNSSTLTIKEFIDNLVDLLL